VVTYSIDKASRPATPIVPWAPLPNTQVYLLDPEQLPRRSVSRQSSALSGAGIGPRLCYLGQRGLRDRFLDDPFSKHPGARLYRTVDRARAAGRHATVFLSRLDFQV
jgi:arthrofactin-type cyclic lipopeptide synthetase C